jgi:hypothetical protein
MEQSTYSRDFYSISPSARWMILSKGHTSIPYAKEVAELLEYPGKYASLKYSDMSSFKYFKRSLTLRHLLRMRKARQMFASWRLKAV